MRRKLSFISIPNQQGKNRAWLQLVEWTVLSVYFYVLMEWLFLVTKPSFMDTLGWDRKVEYFLTTGLIFGLVSFAILLIPFVLIQLPGFAKHWRFVLTLGKLLPASFLALTSFLLIDNFTYTLFKFGVVSTLGPWRGLYALLFLGLWIIWFRWLRLHSDRMSEDVHQDDFPLNNSGKLYLSIQEIASFSLIVVSLVIALPELNLNSITTVQAAGESLERRPNIILLGSDGVNADHLSLYGYPRLTSPNLNILAEDSLLVENAFSNAAKTTASTVAMLNGKLPSRTRVLYYPDILSGKDAFQHLPGILRSQGFKTIQMGYPHYLDAYTQNLLDGFDEVNERSIQQNNYASIRRLPLFDENSYFLSVLTKRAGERLQHAFFIHEMSNPYTQLSNNEYNANDEEKIERMLSLLSDFEEQNQPAFFHVHLMGTHGGKFRPRHIRYSRGQAQSSSWMTDFYDDALVDFDAHVGKVVEELSQQGLLENTILVIYSDHAQQFETDERIPLLFRFPNREYAGQIESNAALVDVPATLLDYLGQPIPDWMDGISLLDGEPDPTRMIFSFGIPPVKHNDEGIFALIPNELQSPFYQVGHVRTIACDKWYYIDLVEFAWATGEVDGHSAPCREAELPSEQDIQQAVLNQLKTDGFDVSTLSTFFDER